MNKHRAKTMLGGKLKIETLPLFKPPFKKTIKGTKRLLLGKGELAEIYNSKEPIRYIAYVEFPAGKTRGGHWHSRPEFFYIISGEMSLKIADAVTGEKRELKVKAGDLLSLAPKIAHIFKTIKPGHALEFSRKLFLTKDTFPYKF